MTTQIVLTFLSLAVLFLLAYVGGMVLFQKCEEVDNARHEDTTR